MLNSSQLGWTRVVELLAVSAGHIYPKMAACEASLESNYGTSLLAVKANNLFGTKAHHHGPSDQTVMIPTKEWESGSFILVDANWTVYSSILDSLKDRMSMLTRLAPHYPNYAAALAAKTPGDYVRAVSKTWSTDPDRAHKVIAISWEVFPGYAI
jgi:flagellum-specific peptidoglycan hydrolase FlgJ